VNNQPVLRAIDAEMRDLSDTQPSNEDLAARAQCGCLSSFEELLRRFQVPVLHFLRRVGPACDAEDVLQETFLRAYSRLASYRPPWRFSTWLFAIARHLSINYHRRRQPAIDHDAIRLAVSPAAGPEQLAVAADSNRHLWSVASRILGREEQTALWLHYVEDMAVGEVAMILDRSAVSVKTMMFRARKKLLPLIGELEPDGPSKRPTRTLEVTHE
jgi:RNA polymerase sigma-70 factor, ECF subfamily